MFHMIFFLFILSLALISLINCAKSATTEEESYKAFKKKHPRRANPNVERTERISIHGSVDDNSGDDYKNNQHFSLPKKKHTKDTKETAETKDTKETAETKDTKNTKDTRDAIETKETQEATKEAKIKTKKESSEESESKWSLSASMSYTQEEFTEHGEKRHERKHRSRHSKNRSCPEKHRRSKKMPPSSLQKDTPEKNGIPAPLKSAIQPVSIVDKTQDTESSIGTVTDMKTEGHDGKIYANKTQEDTKE